MNSRWQASRIGLINFWYYDDQEFPFVKGFKYLKGLFGGKTAEKAAEQAAEAVS